MAIPSSAPAFQFHKGAIETLVGVPMVAASNGFQLHKGAIETQARRRLRQQRGAFNSIKVRLKPSFRHRPLLQTSFQFHKGAIETQGRKIIEGTDRLSIP